MNALEPVGVAEPDADVEAIREADRARDRQAKEDLREVKRASTVADVDLDACEYDELQRLALLLGVRANQSPVDLVREIRRAEASTEGVGR